MLLVLAKPRRLIIESPRKRIKRFLTLRLDFHDSKRHPVTPSITIEINLGHGSETFQRAKLAIRQWKMFDVTWVSLCWPETPTEPGATVACSVPSSTQTQAQDLRHRP